MSDTEEAETKVVQFEVKEEPAKDETEHELETNKVVEEVKAKKKGRGHRVITDEERERLKEQLARGRATALENRRKKKLAKQAGSTASVETTSSCVLEWRRFSRPTRPRSRHWIRRRRH